MTNPEANTELCATDIVFVLSQEDPSENESSSSTPNFYDVLPDLKDDGKDKQIAKVTSNRIKNKENITLGNLSAKKALNDSYQQLKVKIGEICQKLTHIHLKLN